MQSGILHDPEYVLKIRNDTRRKREMDVYHYTVHEFMNLHSKKVRSIRLKIILKKTGKHFSRMNGDYIVRYLTGRDARYRGMTVFQNRQPQDISEFWNR